MTYADVIVPLSVAGTFTYEILEEFLDDCEVGKRVIVQFGRRKYYTAVVVEIHTQKPDYQTKPIFSVLDKYPIVSELHLKLWRWIAEYYMCNLGDVYSAAVPISLRIESQTQISLAKQIVDVQLSKNEQIIIDKLNEQKTLTIGQIEKIINVKNPLNVVNRLINKDLVEVYEHFKPNYKPKYVKYVKISPSVRTDEDLQEIFSKLSRAKKQADILLSYVFLSDLKFVEGKAVFKEVMKKDLLEKSGISAQVLKSLLAKDILVEYEKQISRLKDYSVNQVSFNKLSDIQQVANNKILADFEQKDVVLLYGVTSSGKTEIYINLIRKYLSENKQILYLLPEIALTTQIIERLRAAFGDMVGIYHSKFNDAERAEIWNRIRKNPANKKPYKIILGVRSAIFLPFDNLGLIIVDEEHETTYKQFDPAPRYNARDVAVVLAKMHNAKVLLGTATPSVESYFNAKNGKFALVELKKRHRNIELPEIIVADTRTARKKRQMKSIFHPVMIDAIAEALGNAEQVILFQNRRGFSPYVECKTCGWIPKCRNCDVNLTYHIDTNDLVCHYCGYKQPIPQKCSLCGDTAIETRGFGTQKIEDEIKIFFPEARVGRLDLDVARRKHGYEMALAEFDAGNVDILVGTQMVTKGLDFENVRLVGVLNADNLLNFPDFRSFERSFQLMTQVSGRAGRMHDRGKVIIQTSQPAHKVIKYVLENDFETFFAEEIQERQKYAYPPFVRLIRISVKHKNEQTARTFATNYTAILRKYFGRFLIGPYDPLIKRIQNYFYREMMIKAGKEISLPKAKKILMNIATELKSQKNFSNVIVVFNVDPI